MITSFQLTTPRMIGLDPGYDLDAVALMGCLIEPCRQGSWHILNFPLLVDSDGIVVGVRLEPFH